jgi:hypothetical protein
LCLDLLYVPFPFQISHQNYIQTSHSSWPNILLKTLELCSFLYVTDLSSHMSTKVKFVCTFFLSCLEKLFLVLHISGTSRHNFHPRWRMRIHNGSIAPATPQQRQVRYHSAVSAADVFALCSQDAPPDWRILRVQPSAHALSPCCNQPVALPLRLIFTSLIFLQLLPINMTHTHSPHTRCQI